jgi:ribosome-binding protein aMBF1 (putative translation factor)/putative component of toxin-antitoxin plasmid stabilization module
VAELELHDEVMEWMDTLDEAGWDRTVVVIDRLAALGSSARMPLSKSLGDGLFELRFTLGPTARWITCRFTKDGRIILLTTFRKQRKNAQRDHPGPQGCRGLCRAVPVKETTMANYSRWDDIKRKRPGPDADTRAGVEQDLALGQLIYDLRTEAGLSQRELAERMGTTQSVISRLEEGGGARNRIDTLARVATALDRHLVVSFPEKVPAKLKDAVQVA